MIRELFLQNLSYFCVFPLLSIAAWFIFALLNKFPKTHIWIFMLSHYLVYVDAFIFESGNLFLSSCIILLLTLSLLFTRRLKNERFRWVYFVYSAILLLLLVFVFALHQIDFSILATR